MTNSQTYGIATLKRPTEETAVRADACIGDSTYTGTITHNGKDYPWRGRLLGFSLYGHGSHGAYAAPVKDACQELTVFQATPEEQRSLCRELRRHFEALSRQQHEQADAAAAYFSMFHERDMDLWEKEEHPQRGGHP